MDEDQRHAKWCDEFKYLTGFVNLLHTRIVVWEAIDAELVRMQRPGSGFVVALFRPMVGESQGVLVRRLLDNDKRARSLVRLVGEMAKHHTVLTRARYVGQWQPNHASEADDAFDVLAQKTGADHLPHGVLLQLRAMIVDAGEELQKSVNQIVAHDQAEKTAEPFTWGQVKQAIYDLSVHYVTVGKMLTGDYHEPVPFVTPEWRAAFRDGLFGPGAREHEIRHLIEGEAGLA